MSDAPLITSGQAPPQLSSDERTMAAIAHAAAGVLGVALVGLAIPIIIYMAYEGRSRYVRYHAFQALIFQIGASVAVGAITAGTCCFGVVLVPLPMAIQLYYAWLAWQGSWEPYPLMQSVGVEERAG